MEYVLNNVKYKELGKHVRVFFVVLIVPILLASFTIYIVFESIFVAYGLRVNNHGLQYMFMLSLFSAPFLTLMIQEIYKSDKSVLPVRSSSSPEILFYCCLALILSESMTFVVDELELVRSNFFHGMVNSHVELILGFMAICITAPIFEEILYRGILYRALEKSNLASTSIILFSSVVFTLSHTQYGSVDLVIVFFLGIYLGWVRCKTNSLFAPIACHAVINCTSYFMIVFS